MADVNTKTQQYFFCVTELTPDAEIFVRKTVDSSVEPVDWAVLHGELFDDRYELKPNPFVSSKNTLPPDKRWKSLVLPLQIETFQSLHRVTWDKIAEIMEETESNTLTMRQLNGLIWRKSNRRLWPKILLQSVETTDGKNRVIAILDIDSSI
jgi:hypothetical protein